MRKSGSSLTKNSKTGTVRILGYCRESTSKQFNEGFNISDQEKRIRSYIEIYFADTKYELEIVREAASASSLDMGLSERETIFVSILIQNYISFQKHVLLGYALFSFLCNLHRQHESSQ